MIDPKRVIAPTVASSNRTAPPPASSAHTGPGRGPEAVGVKPGARPAPDATPGANPDNTSGSNTHAATTPPELVTEASHPGSSQPNRADAIRPNGLVVSKGLLSNRPTFPSEQFPGAVSRSAFTAGSFTAPPQASEHRGTNALIRKPALTGPSVLGTLVSATPVGNIASVAQGLANVKDIPLLPAGLRQRLVESLPSGARTRATVWARAVARVRSSRPTSGNRIGRE